MYSPAFPGSLHLDDCFRIKYFSSWMGTREAPDTYSKAKQVLYCKARRQVFKGTIPKHRQKMPCYFLPSSNMLWSVIIRSLFLVLYSFFFFLVNAEPTAVISVYPSPPQGPAQCLKHSGGPINICWVNEWNPFCSFAGVSLLLCTLQTACRDGGDYNEHPGYFAIHGWPMLTRYLIKSFTCEWIISSIN